MNRHTLSTATVGCPAAAGQPSIRAATPADAAGIVRLRSAYVLCEPMSEE